MSAAIKYLSKAGLKNISKQEEKVNKIISEGLVSEDKVELIGPKDYSLRSGIFNFNIRGMDPHNIAAIMDESKNIAIRSGAHCVHSWFNKHNMKGSARASLYLYNTEGEAETFVEEIRKLLKHFN